MTRALAVVIASLCLAAPLHAAPEVDPYVAGKRLFEQKRYADALEAFRRALARTPRPEVLYSLAQTQRLLGDCPNAVDTYRAYLSGRPTEPFASYARANIERCEHAAPSPSPPPPPPTTPEHPAWYRDVAGHALVGGGLAAAITGAVIFRSGRSAATDVADAPDYETFLARRSAAASAVTEQWIGIAAMIAGGAAIAGGVVHYVHHRRGLPRSVVGITPIPGGAMISSAGRF